MTFSFAFCKLMKLCYRGWNKNNSEGHRGPGARNPSRTALGKTAGPGSWQLGVDCLCCGVAEMPCAHGLRPSVSLCDVFGVSSSNRAGHA